MKAWSFARTTAACAVLCTATMASWSGANAATVPPGSYYTDVIGGGVGSAPPGYTRTDDGSFGAYSLGFGGGGFTFFGSTYSSFYVNNNGSISFGAPANARSDDPLNRNTQAPMIAPFGADVDTRPANGGTVSLRSDPNQIIVTWDRVGFYDQRTDRAASFQLVLRGDGYSVPGDEGRIGFFYRDLGWESSDAQGGTDGFGGIEAMAGFGDGLFGVNAGEFAFALSGEAGIAAFLSNHHYWFNLSGADGLPALLVPEPATLLLIAAGVLGIASTRKRRIERSSRR